MCLSLGLSCPSATTGAVRESRSECVWEWDGLRRCRWVSICLSAVSWQDLGPYCTICRRTHTLSVFFRNHIYLIIFFAPNVNGLQYSGWPCCLKLLKHYSETPSTCLCFCTNWINYIFSTLTRFMISFIFILRLTLPNLITKLSTC